MCKIKRGRRCCPLGDIRCRSILFQGRKVESTVNESGSVCRHGTVEDSDSDATANGVESLFEVGEVKAVLSLC